MMAVSLPFQQHSNLSKMQSFSYREHNLERRYSCTWNKGNDNFRDNVRKTLYNALEKLCNGSFNADVPRMHFQFCKT